MKDKLVPVYEGLVASDAQMLAQRLSDAGIEAFVDLTDSPIDGLIESRKAKIVLVRQVQFSQAQAIVHRFEEEGFAGVHGEDERAREETGLEIPTQQIPSQDSPSQDIEGTGVERLDYTPGDRMEAPELEGMQYEGPGSGRRDVPLDEPVARFGGDRDILEPADVEQPEVENQRIEDLDVSREIDEPETGTPAANLRPPKEKRRRKAG